MILLLRIADRLRRVVWRYYGPRMIGVRGIVADVEGRVLLVRHSYGPDVWYLPGGGVKRREGLQEGLCRELLEETGVSVTGPLQLLGTYSNLSDGKSDHISVFVVGQWTSVEARSAEIAESGWFGLDALPSTTSPGTRRRLAEWANGERGNASGHFDW